MVGWRGVSFSFSLVVRCLMLFCWSVSWRAGFLRFKTFYRVSIYSSDCRGMCSMVIVVRQLGGEVLVFKLCDVE